MNDIQILNIVMSIEKHEGFSSKPYIDPLVKNKIPKKHLKIIEKYWDNLNITIGHGRCLQTNPLTKLDSEYLITFEVETIFSDLIKELLFFNDLPIYVQNVLIEMAYQLGMNGLFKFKKTLEHIENQDFKSASIEMLNSKWAKQTPKRAKTLSNLMRGGN
ncbi:glycoside hydrolase family protein [Arcobacter sp. 15-2]|uniref:lysozyme n=1 Tax=Arcobacter sp. 15-2 TaxID=3374109 RepID=UPI00399CCF50